MKLKILGKAIEYKLKNSKKHKQTLVFIHGWMDSMGSNNWYRELEDYFNILVFDLPGHGKSQYLSKYSIQVYAQFTKELLIKLNIKEPIIISHSMGCLIAGELLKILPGHISKVVLIDPPQGNFPIVFKLIIPVLKAVNKLGILERTLNTFRYSHRFQQLWFDTLVGKQSLNTQNARDHSKEGMESVDIEAVKHGVLAIIAGEMRLDLRVFENLAEVFLVYGSEDKVVNEILIDSYLPSNRLFCIKGHSHTPNRTASHEFNNIIKGIFIKA